MSIPAQHPKAGPRIGRMKGGESGDPYGTRSRLKAFGNLRVDASKRLNESVLIRKTQKV